MIISENPNTFEQAPTGAHRAICVSVVDIGTQRKEYQGKTQLKREVRIGFELVDVLIKSGDHAGQPFTITQFYTASLHENAKLREHLKNWRGQDFTPAELKAFDLRNILGKPCTVSVVHNDKGRSVIGGIMSPVKGQAMPALANQILHFSLDEFDRDAFESLSDGIKEMIKRSPEYQAIVGSHPKQSSSAGHDGLNDDIPF